MVRIAGEEARSPRSETNHSSYAAAPACRNTHRSCGTPASSAAATLVTRTAAARSTWRFAHSSLVYGELTIRLSASARASRSAVCASGIHACSLAAATSENRDHSPVIVARCSSGVSPVRHRSAASISA
jgi:hypothetical protein